MEALRYPDSAEDTIAVYDKREDSFVLVTRQEAIDGIMRRAASIEPGKPHRAVVEAAALALARCGAVDSLAVANFWDPPGGEAVSWTLEADRDGSRGTITVAGVPECAICGWWLA